MLHEAMTDLLYIHTGNIQPIPTTFFAPMVSIADMGHLQDLVPQVVVLQGGDDRDTCVKRNAKYATAVATDGAPRQGVQNAKG